MSSWVELHRWSVYSDADATKLNSTSSCRHVHSLNNYSNTTQFDVWVELCRYKRAFNVICCPILVNTIFWKRINQFWCKLVQMVRRARTWNDHFGDQAVKNGVKTTRYLKNCWMDSSHTAHAAGTCYDKCRCVAARGCKNVKVQGHVRPNVDSEAGFAEASFLTPWVNSSFIHDSFSYQCFSLHVVMIILYFIYDMSALS